MVKGFSKITETRDELSTNCNPKVMSRCLSEPDATSLHHCLKNKQLKLIWLQWCSGHLMAERLKDRDEL